MEQVIQPTQEILNLIVQVMLIIVPILITWFIRTYVRGSQSERDIAAIARLSNVAIDYVENLDRSGRLMLPPDVSKGAHKLKLASEWMEEELNRAGVQITTEEATEWISAEFQKRVGDVQLVGTMADLAREAVDLVASLEQKGLITVPPDSDRVAFLANLTADWMRTKLAERSVTASTEEVMAWVRTEWLNRLATQPAVEPVAVITVNLETLAGQAVNFLNQFEANNPLTPTGSNFKADLAIAWMLVEATKRGMQVTPTEIAQAAMKALPTRW
jgi:hypothetical protein